MRPTPPVPANLGDLVKLDLITRDTTEALGIEAVAFDRSGYRYHGRVQALADAAREGGLKF